MHYKSTTIQYRKQKPKKKKIISIQDIYYGYTSIINTIVLRIWASASNYKNNIIFFVVARWSLVYLVGLVICYLLCTSSTNHLLFSLQQWMALRNWRFKRVKWKEKKKINVIFWCRFHDFEVYICFSVIFHFFRCASIYAAVGLWL